MSVAPVRRVTWLACACALVLAFGIASSDPASDPVSTDVALHLQTHASAVERFHPSLRHAPVLHSIGSRGAIRASVLIRNKDDDPADDSDEEFGSGLQTRDTASTRDPVAAPPLDRNIIPAPHADAALPSFVPLDPSTPRAPPV